MLDHLAALMAQAAHRALEARKNADGEYLTKLADNAEREFLRYYQEFQDSRHRPG